MPQQVAQSSRPVQFVNQSGSKMPARALARLTQSLSNAPDGSPRFAAIRPDGEEGVYIVNWDHEVPENGEGVGDLLPDAHVVLTKDQAFELGTEIGPESGKWEATEGGKGLLFMYGPDAAGLSGVVPIGGSSTDVPASGGGAGGCCNCTCLDTGDIEVGGVRTTSVWLASIGQVNERQANGVITVQAAEHQLKWDDAEGYWVGEVDPELLSAKYLDGADATAATTMSAEIVLRQNDGGYTTLTLTITGTVPEPD